jgi:hypothetical protein
LRGTVGSPPCIFSSTSYPDQGRPGSEGRCTEPTQSPLHRSSIPEQGARVRGDRCSGSGAAARTSYAPGHGRSCAR